MRSRENYKSIITIGANVAVLLVLAVKILPFATEKVEKQPAYVQQQKTAPGKLSLQSIILPAPPKPSPASILPKVPSQKVLSRTPLLKALKPQENNETITPLKVTASPTSAPKPMATPRQKPQLQPSPPQIETMPKIIIPKQKDRKMGRRLLRVLEHGKGPLIEIIWPEGKAARDQLYSYLSSCHGMISAYLDQDKFYKVETKGVWQINTDIYSGYLRESTGILPTKEDLKLRQVKSQHTLSPQAVPVRLFPRQSDAGLLGGLNQLIGPDYMKAAHISGTYQLTQGELQLVNIKSDTGNIAGKITLPASHKICTRTL